MDVAPPNLFRKIAAIGSQSIVAANQKNETSAMMANAKPDKSTREHPGESANERVTGRNRLAIYFPIDPKQEPNRRQRIQLLARFVSTSEIVDLRVAECN